MRRYLNLEEYIEEAKRQADNGNPGAELSALEHALNYLQDEIDGRRRLLAKRLGLLQPRSVESRNK